MKKFVAVLLVLVLLFCAAGCSTDGGEVTTSPQNNGTTASAQPAGNSGDGGSDFTAGYCQTTATVFYDGVYAGLEDAVKENGGSIIRMDSELDLQKELANVESLISQNVDVLFISPVDAAGSCAAIKLANEANIPVIAIVSQPQGDCEYLTYIKSNDVQAAYDVADWAFEQIGDEGDVLLIDGAPVSDVQDRMKGYRQAIEDHPNINLVGEGRVKPEEFSMATVTRVTEDLIQAYPSAKVILGFCGYCIPGCMTALETYNRTDVIVVDVDGTPEETKQIADGRAAHCATQGQYPYKFGTTAVETYMQYREDPNTEFPEFTEVATMLVTKDNVNEYDGYTMLENRE